MRICAVFLFSATAMLLNSKTVSKAKTPRLTTQIVNIVKIPYIFETISPVTNAIKTGQSLFLCDK